MINSIVSKVSKGFLYGLGFALAFIMLFYCIAFFNFYPEKSLFNQNDQSQQQNKYLKELLTTLGESQVDLCKDMDGTWLGTDTSENGQYITEWVIDLNKDGAFHGIVKYKTITQESIEIQKGTWECIGNILFTKVEIEGKTNNLNYILFSNDGQTRVYATIERYSLGLIFRSIKKINPQENQGLI